jgi:Protein of unknown function (DUF4239)
MPFEILAPLLIFFALVAASLGALHVHGRFADHLSHDETNNTIRLTANLFTVMTSLMLGLMLNSAKNTLASVDRNFHANATQIILLDKTLRRIGPDGDMARHGLLAYAQKALQDRKSLGDAGVTDKQLEQTLNAVGDNLNHMTPTDGQQVELWHDAQQQFQKLVEMRWTLIEQEQGTIPPPLIGLLGACLVLIFASFGYRAPPNFVVVSTLLVSAFLISAAIYLILDMDVPYSGPIQISPEPLQRAILELQA